MLIYQYVCNCCRPGSIRADAFRGRGLSLLALAKGMSALFAKNGFRRPSLKYCGVFGHVLFPQMSSVGRVIADPGQVILRQLLHRTKKIGLYFRGVTALHSPG